MFAPLDFVIVYFLPKKKRLVDFFISFGGSFCCSTEGDLFLGSCSCTRIGLAKSIFSLILFVIISDKVWDLELVTLFVRYGGFHAESSIVWLSRKSAVHVLDLFNVVQSFMDSMCVFISTVVKLSSNIRWYCGLMWSVFGFKTHQTVMAWFLECPKNMPTLDFGFHFWFWFPSCSLLSNT